MKRIFAKAALLLLVAALGCGRTPADMPTTHPVTGTIVQADGQPLTGGAIYFRCPADPRLEAVSDVGPDGRFTLYTMFDGARLEGAIAGEHEVSVVPPSASGSVPGAVVLPQPHEVKPQPNELTIELPP